MFVALGLKTKSFTSVCLGKIILNNFSKRIDHLHGREEVTNVEPCRTLRWILELIKSLGAATPIAVEVLTLKLSVSRFVVFVDICHETATAI